MTSQTNILEFQDVIKSMLSKSSSRSTFIHVKRLATIRGILMPGELWEDIIKYYLNQDFSFIINKQNNIPIINLYNDIPKNSNKIKLFEYNKFKLIHNSLPLYGFINGISEQNQIVYLINMNLLQNYYIKFKHEGRIQGLLEILYSYGIEMDCLLIDINNVLNTHIIKRDSNYFNSDLINRINEFYNIINVKK